MRLLFFGSGAFGLPTLAWLCDHHDVALVISQPDRPAGRKRRMTPTPVAQWAEAHGLEVVKPLDVNAEDSLGRIHSAHADANIVIAFGQKIGPSVIGSPTHGAMATVNLHASVLPLYRGAAPIQWAMVQQETQTGNTVFSLTDRMDAGDVLGVVTTDIDPAETAGELHDRLSEMGPSVVEQVLADLESGSLRPKPQDESAVTIAPKLSRQDGRVDWGVSANEIRCRVHGLTPWPGVSVWWSVDDQMRQPLLLRRVATEPDLNLSGQQPGFHLGDGLVATGDGAVRLLEVQEPGKRLMSWVDFKRGRKIEAGVMFYSDES